MKTRVDYIFWGILLIAAGGMVDCIGDQTDVDDAPDGKDIPGRDKINVKGIRDPTGIQPVDGKAIRQDIDDDGDKRDKKTVICRTMFLMTSSYSEILISRLVLFAPVRALCLSNIFLSRPYFLSSRRSTLVHTSGSGTSRACAGTQVPVSFPSILQGAILTRLLLRMRLTLPEFATV
jgi:hypothetical protein